MFVLLLVLLLVAVIVCLAIAAALRYKAVWRKPGRCSRRCRRTSTFSSGSPSNGHAAAADASSAVGPADGPAAASADATGASAGAAGSGVAGLAGYTRLEAQLRPINDQNRPGRRPNPRVKRSLSSGAGAGGVEFTASSTNWSGYVESSSLTSPVSGTVTSVSGTWVVPTVTATPGQASTYCAIWVGLDGFSDSTVEQLGTEQDVINGRVEAYAWIEMYPGGALEIVGFPVNPGDSITASVTYNGGSQFTMTIANNTRHVFFAVPGSYTRLSGAQLSSAEWIVEAPWLNGVLPLAHFSTVSFSNCAATVRGVSGTITNCNAQEEPINMISSNGSHIKAQPSSLNSSGNAFSVAWVAST
jgi:hypothetical protein